MSSNNQLVIRKIGKGKDFSFEIHHDLCVDNKFVPDKKSLLGVMKTLKQAIHFANRFCRENDVEYGYIIMSK